MIISHKYKFIFIKPTKVAGTSFELGVYPFLGKNDVATEITKYSPCSDSHVYSHISQNAKDFYNHMSPSEIRLKIGDDIWNSYLKITIVRNPFDQVISRFYWDQSRKKGELQVSIRSMIQTRRISFREIKTLSKKYIEYLNYDFNNLVELYDESYINSRFYFDLEGNPICDYYIRYENLDYDYHKFCKIVGMPYIELPKTKSQTRKNRKHYSFYYNQNSKVKIELLTKNEIDFFGYKFENHY